jgi:ABC-2 type transport system permease protein
MFFTVLIVEWLKTRRTPVRWLVWGTPLALAAPLIWYLAYKASGSAGQLMAYQTFFETWTALVIPVGAGLLTGILIHQEELAGSFNGLLGSGLSRTSIYLGKFMMLSLLSLTSTCWQRYFW